MTLTTPRPTPGPRPAPGTADDQGARERAWWRDAVVYQVYIRSFADGDGDGTGDITGLRQRLPHLAALGVDAVWINPWYPSPMADSGYDVSDYRDVEPVFGTLEQADAMIAEAHALGLRVVLDIVPNHSSDRHAWFVEALAAPAGSRERARYVFRDGRGPGGAEPPNDWQSQFGGPAWTRTQEADGRGGQWYLHLFAPGQPDFDWTHPDVHEEFETTLRFWFDRGVDGLRIDVAHGLAKVDGLPDVGATTWPLALGSAVGHPHWDVDAVHGIWQRWRAVADSYDEPRIFVAEAWTGDPDRLALYLRPDELHTAFNFDFLVAPWAAAPMRATIDSTLRSHAAVGAPPTWVLSNHDVLREVSRYARPQDVRDLRRLDDVRGLPTDLALGLRRARAAALLMLALPGGAYVYQGAELGLPEVEDLPEEALQDPTWEQSGHELRGRDGCRVPLPWSGSAPPFGFSPQGSAGGPWLPQPASFAGSTVADQEGDPSSTLELYRSALRLRHEEAALGDGTMTWLEAPEGVLALAREPGFGALVNFSAEPARLPEGAVVLLASADLLPDGRVGTDTAVWFRRTAA